MVNTNCPNCGAVVNGPKCEYCGTIFSSHINEIKLLMDKTRLIRQAAEVESLYACALTAMREYAQSL